MCGCSQQVKLHGKHFQILYLNTFLSQSIIKVFELHLVHSVKCKIMGDINENKKQISIRHAKTSGYIRVTQCKVLLVAGK